MMRIIVVLFMVLGIGFSTGLRGDEYREKVKPLKWMGDKKPDTFEQYNKVFPVKPFKMSKVGKYSRVPASARAAQKVIVLVNSSIYSSIQGYVSQYVNDISALGYDVVLLTSSGGTAESIKNTLKSYSNLLGCVMIGQLPSAWYEVANDYNSYGYAEFPCDLFLMDLDGTWTDSDGDGKYDNHAAGSGDRQPEIFVARIDASNMGGSEVSKLQSYFAKNHSFWSGNVPFNTNGMAYTEDDWVNYPDIADHLSYLCGSTTYKVKAPNTNRTDYQTNYLPNSAYYVTQLACHSSSGGHYFTRGGVLYTSSVVSAPPQSIAYNLFCCSGLRYTSSYCLGKGYIFNSGKSLVAVGSSKTGSMLEFRYFYYALSQSKSIGASLVTWFNSIGSYDMSTVYWHYGMTILGDPMVYLASQP